MERWRDIPGFDGLYEASTLGRVRSYAKFSDMPNGGSQFYSAKIMAAPMGLNGYRTLNLWKDRAGRQFTVHYLIALTFIPNPENLPYIKHLDGRKTNNAVHNLKRSISPYNPKRYENDNAVRY